MNNQMSSENKLQNSIRVKDFVALSGCLSDKNNIPVFKGLVNSQSVNCIRDSRASSIIVARKFVKEDELTGEIIYVELADGIVRKVPVCNIYVDCPFYKGRTRAICFKNPVYDLLIGNVPSALDKSCTEEVISDKPKSIED